MNPIISIQSATKTYGPVTALDNINLDIAEGEFLTLLGPSGSGKTTMLMSLAGFTELESGTITLKDQNITQALPEKRGFGMVFQGFALFPNMTVYGNVAFPLKVRGWSKDKIEKRVMECLDMVEMGAFVNRMPSQLSGGQQQRVALARAISFGPSVLLLDEPLSALDKKLRQSLRWELKDLHNKLGVTFVYVTHDQEEALSMSDRIVILDNGRIQQEGNPQILYNSPKNTFVADFLGDSNFFDVKIVKANGEGFVCSVAHESFPVKTSKQLSVGSRYSIALRPERVLIGPPGEHLFKGEIQKVLYLGGTSQVIITHESFGQVHTSLNMRVQKEPLTKGSDISFGWDNDACVFLEDE